MNHTKQYAYAAYGIQYALSDLYSWNSTSNIGQLQHKMLIDKCNIFLLPMVQHNNSCNSYIRSKMIVKKWRRTSARHIRYTESKAIRWRTINHFMGWWKTCTILIRRMNWNFGLVWDEHVFVLFASFSLRLLIFRLRFRRISFSIYETCTFEWIREHLRSQYMLDIEHSVFSYPPYGHTRQYAWKTQYCAISGSVYFFPQHLSYFFSSFFCSAFAICRWWFHIRMPIPLHTNMLGAFFHFPFNAIICLRIENHMTKLMIPLKD